MVLRLHRTTPIDAAHCIRLGRLEIEVPRVHWEHVEEQSKPDVSMEGR
jgi:hypothetical protein